MEKKYTFNMAAMGTTPHQNHYNLLDLLKARLQFWQKHYMTPSLGKHAHDMDALFDTEFPALVYNTMLLCRMNEQQLADKLSTSAYTIKRYIAQEASPKARTRGAAIANLTDIVNGQMRELKNKLKKNGSHPAGEGPIV